MRSSFINVYQIEKYRRALFVMPSSTTMLPHWVY